MEKNLLFLLTFLHKTKAHLQAVILSKDHFYFLKIILYTIYKYKNNSDQSPNLSEQYSPLQMYLTVSE